MIIKGNKTTVIKAQEELDIIKYSILFNYNKMNIINEIIINKVKNNDNVFKY